MTLAPELPGALELVDELVARGVTVSCGHTDATAAQAHAAFDRGARTVTHLFNAMRPSTPRDPGIAMAALARADVTVQLIVDGHHLAGETVLVAWRAARGRFALVSDAVAAAGMGDGAFTLGGTQVTAAGGAVRRADGTLAGSAASIIDGVRNLHALGAPLEDALEAASSVPARIAGRTDLGPPGGRRAGGRGGARRPARGAAGAGRGGGGGVSPRGAYAARRRAGAPAMRTSPSSPTTTTRLRPLRLASYRAASAARKRGW